MKKRRIGKGMLRTSRIAADHWGQRSYTWFFFFPVSLSGIQSSSRAATSPHAKPSIGLCGQNFALWRAFVQFHWPTAFEYLNISENATGVQDKVLDA